MPPLSALPRAERGRRGPNALETRQGRQVRSEVPPLPGQLRGADLALHATLLAAAPHQSARRSPDGPAIAVDVEDYRRQVRRRRTGRTILFVVDSSGSMGARRRMIATKGAILTLLTEAYQRRDRVGLIAFRGTTAELLLPLTTSASLARQRLERLPTGGPTPFARGLMLARDVAAASRRRNPLSVPLLVVLSDGRANVALAPGADPMAETEVLCASLRKEKMHGMLLDTESGPVRMGWMSRYAAAWGAGYYHLDDVRTEGVAEVVRTMLGR